MATVSSCRDGDNFYRLDEKGSQDMGNQWDDGAGGDVREICICHGQIIYSIQTTYEHQGTLLRSRRHGGTEGDFDFISLSSPLTWVSGHYCSWCLDPDGSFFPLHDEDDWCNVICSLKFGTADGATYGPYGSSESGEPFAFRCNTGIAGFHGHDDSSRLYAIGVYVKSAAKGVIDDPPIISKEASADVNSALLMSKSSSTSTQLDEPEA